MRLAAHECQAAVGRCLPMSEVRHCGVSSVPRGWVSVTKPPCAEVSAIPWNSDAVLAYLLRMRAAVAAWLSVVIHCARSAPDEPAPALVNAAEIAVLPTGYAITSGWPPARKSA